MSAVLKTPGETWLRIQCEDAYHEAVSVREAFEKALRAALPAAIPFDVVENYATARAREILAREKLERYGFL